jgi:hypothetical protein
MQITTIKTIRAMTDHCGSLIQQRAVHAAIGCLALGGGVKSSQAPKRNNRDGRETCSLEEVDPIDRAVDIMPPRALLQRIVKPCEELALTVVGVFSRQDHNNILQPGTVRIPDKLPHHVSNLVGPIGSPILADEYCLPNTRNRRVIVMSE